MSEIMYSLSYLSSGECLRRQTLQQEKYGTKIICHLFDLHFHVGLSLMEGNSQAHPSLPLPGPSLLWCDESRHLHLTI